MPKSAARPAVLLLPFQITVQPVVIRSEDGRLLGALRGDPVVFEGHDAHEKAIEWLQAWPDLLASHNAEVVS